MRVELRVILGIWLACSTGIGVAQAPPPLVNPNLQLFNNGTVNAVVRLPSGDLVVGGSFVSVAGTPRANIAKLHADGTLDANWNPSADGAILSLACDTAGNVYAAGEFSAIGGLPRRFIARLSGSGSGAVDAAWDPLPDGIVYTVATDADGNVYAGGYFTFIGGQDRSNLAKLSGSGTGSADATWDPSPDSSVDTLAVDSGGNVYAGGHFTFIGGQNRSSLAKLSGSGAGSADAAWDPSPDGIVVALAFDGDNVYVSGYFTFLGGQNRNYLAKLSGTGSGAADAVWNPSPDDVVNTLVTDTFGNVYAGGIFSAIGGKQRKYIAKLSGGGAGVAAASWAPAVDGAVKVLTSNGGTICAGGSFANVAGQPRFGFAELNVAGTLVGAATDIESPGTVYALARQSDGKMIFGGSFVKANGQRRGNLLRLLADGSLDPSWSPMANDFVIVLVVDANDNVYAGGGFTSIGGLTRKHIAKLSGGSGAADANWNPAPNDVVYTLAPDTTGNVYAGGNFTSIGGQARDYIAKLSMSGSGSADANWNPMANAFVDALAIGAGGAVYAGGGFTTIGGQNRNYIAKIPGNDVGAVDADWNPSADNWIEALAVDAGGNVYAGGLFSTIGGVQHNAVVALSGSGSGAADETWNPPLSGYVYNLMVDPGGNLYVAGEFNTLSGQRNLTLLSGSGTGAVDATWNPNPDQYTAGLAFDASGNIVVGGAFAVIGGQQRVSLAALPAGDLLFANAFEDRFASTACVTNAECTGGKVCAAHRCSVPGSIGIGGNCSANRDCIGGLFCSPSGTCSPAGTEGVGGTCSTGTECNADLACKLYGLGGTCAAAGSSDLGQSCVTTGDCIAGLSCGAAGTCMRTVDAYPPFAGVACAADADPFRVFFEVPRPGNYPSDFFRLPFPNDIRVNDDGTLDLTDFPRPGSSILGFDLVDRYADSLSAGFSGFSSVGGVTFRFSKELEFDSLGANGQGVHFVDITDPAEPGFGSDRGRAYGYDTGAHPYVCQQALVVAPNPYDPLRPGGKYAVYLTSAIRSHAGNAPIQDPDLAAVLAPTAPADPILAKAWTRYANFRTFLAMNAMTPDQIAAVSVITVQDTTAKLLALRNAVEAQPAPALSDLTVCAPAVTSPCAIAGDSERVCGDSAGAFWEIHGRMSIPNFQQGTLPYEEPADGGQVVFDAGGVPVQAGTLDVCFALTVPKSAEPASGWPLVVHAHETGGSFRSAIDKGIADELATATVPMATLTFDEVAHGERRGTSLVPPDGLVFNLINPPAALGNHLQGAADVMQVLRLAGTASFSLTGPGTVAFDPAHVYFFGDALGSTVGVPALAVSNRAPAAVLSGAASYLTDELLTRTSPSDAKTALEIMLNDDSLGAGHPFMMLMQNYFDAIDPVNYAPLVLKQPPASVVSKHVYLPWGQGDTYTPAAVLNITAQAMQLQVAEPVLAPIPGLSQVTRPVSGNLLGGDAVYRTAACFQYAPDGPYDGHFVSTQNPSAVQDWIDFLTSHAQSGTPVVP